MNPILLEMSEAQLKEKILEFQQLHNEFQQKTYQLRERVELFQKILLKKQRERIMAANALEKLENLNTTELEKQSGLSREQVIKALALLQQTHE